MSVKPSRLVARQQCATVDYRDRATRFDMSTASVVTGPRATTSCRPSNPRDAIEDVIEWNFRAFRIAVLAGFDELLCFPQCRRVNEHDVLFFGCLGRRNLASLRLSIVRDASQAYHDVLQ
jgi:hypothetical protein